jgi:hypothetical protein
VAHLEVTDEHIDLSAARLVIIVSAPVTAEGISPEYTTECLFQIAQVTMPSLVRRDASAT